MDNGRLNFVATIDDKDYMRKLENMQKGVNGLNFDKPVGQINRIKKEIEEVNSVLLQNRKALTDLNAKISNTAPGQLKNDLKLERNSLKKSIQEDEVALKNLNAELQRTKTSHTTLNAELLKTRQQMQALALAGKTNTAEYQQLSVKAKEYSSVLKQVNTDSNTAKSTFGGLFKTIAGSFGIISAFYAVFSAISGAFKQIVEFDKAMVNMSAIAGQSRKELKDLEVEIRNVAKGSLNTATQVAEMATELIRLGTTPEGVKALLKPVNDLSIATGLAADKTAILVKGTLNAFQEGEGAATRYADVIAASLNLTALDAQKFGDAFKYIGATASVAGYSIEETAAMVGVLVDNNVQASSAGRILSSVFGRMAKSGKEFEAELEKVRTSQDQLGQASKVFGAEGARLAVILANNKSRLADLTTELRNSAGSLDALTKKQLTSVSAQYQIMSSAWTEFILSLDSGNGIISTAAKGFSEFGTNVLQAFTSTTQLSDSLKEEQLGLNMLVGQLTTANISNSERLRLVSELKKNYPDFVALIGEENLSNKNLISTLEKVNENYRERIAMQMQVETDQGYQKAREKATRGVLVAEQNLFEKLNEINIQYNLGLNVTKDNLQETANKVRDLAKENRMMQWDIRGLSRFQKDLVNLGNNLNNINNLYADFRKNNTTPVFSAGETIPESKRQSLEDKRAAEFKAKQEEKANEQKIKSLGTETKIKDLTKERLSFLDQISKAERELNNSVLGEREQVLAKINDKYDDMLKKAKELKANEEAVNRINALREKETAIATYRLDTAALTTSLEQQKKDYEDFENFKKQVGIEKAKEMYSGIIDVSKNYQQVLQDELAGFEGRDLTDAEKERVAALFKMFQDYSIQKQENDRKSLEDLLTMTQSYEQKILNLRAEYDAKRRKLTEDNTITDLESRLAILDKEFRDKLSGIIDDFATTNNLGDIPTTILGSTKSQIMAQIRSLEGYLNTAKNLTKDQVNSIKKIINELNNNLFNATDGQGITSLQGYYNEIKRIEDSLVILETRKQSALDLGGEDAAEKVALLNAQIDALKKRLGDLNNSKIIAIGSEFGRISGFLSETANKFNGVNSGIQKMLNAMAKAVGFASQMNDSFKSMSEHSNAVKDGTANVSTAMSAGMGYIGMFMSLVSVIDRMSQASERQAQRDAERMRLEAERYINQLEYERLLKQSEIDRARREQLGLSSRRKELSALVEMYELEISQIERLSNIIFNETSILFEEWQGGMQNAQLVKFNNSELQKEIDRVKKQLEELYKMDPEGYDEGGLRVRIRIGILQDYLKELEGAMIIGKSWQELQRDLDNGYIADNLKQYVQEYVNLMKAAEEAGYSIEDLQNTMRELATGTTVDELSNKLADAFKNGEYAVYSFAETMEEVLRNAIVTAFKNEYIVKEMDALFKLFGDMGMDGEYTQEELDKIREESRKAAERLQMQWDALYGSLDGFDFGGDFGAGTADGIKRITETQADRLTGILSGMQVDVIASRQILSDSRNLLSSSLDRLVAIDYNTARTYEGVERIENILQNNQQQALGL